MPAQSHGGGKDHQPILFGDAEAGMNPLDSSTPSSGEAGAAALAARADHTTAGVGAHPYTETRDALPLAVCSPRVRLVMDVSWLPADLNLGFYQSVHIDQPAAAVAGHRHIAGGLHQGVELIHALPLGVEQLDVKRVVPV